MSTRPNPAPVHTVVVLRSTITPKKRHLTLVAFPPPRSNRTSPDSSLFAVRTCGSGTDGKAVHNPPQTREEATPSPRNCIPTSVLPWDCAPRPRRAGRQRSVSAGVEQSHGGDGLQHGHAIDCDEVTPRREE